MYLLSAIPGNCWLTILTTCLILGMGHGYASGLEVELPSEDMPAPVGEQGDPFADSPADEDQSNTEEVDLFDDDPNQLVLQDDYYDYEDDCSCCFEDSCCGDFCSAPCAPCTWFRAGYVFWWSNGVSAPPLATSSPDGTDPNQAGVLGLETTTVHFGGSDILGNLRGGGIFELGYWLDPHQATALELNYMFLGEKTDEFLGSQNNFPILARPFLDVESGLQDSRLIAFDNLTEGTLSIIADTSLHTSALAYRCNLYRTRGSRIDYLIGYRFAYMGDSIAIRESTLALAGSNAPGTMIDLLDSFETDNTFHGCELGFEVQREIDHCWSCAFNARVALGGSRLESNIRGRTITNDGATTTTTAGGLLTQDSNIGAYSDSEFNTVSNLGLTFRRRILTNCSVSFGYQFLLWSNVWRAANQIDTNINTSQIDGPLVGAALPAFPGNTDSYWAQGVSINLEGRF